MLDRLWTRHRNGQRTVAFFVIGLVAIATYALVLRFPDERYPAWVVQARRAAVQKDRAGQEVIRAERVRVGLPLSPGDTLRTGMVGVGSSPITTEAGSLEAKRTSTDPLFAAAVVEMLYKAGVRPGDAVAVGMTGSFPAFNLAVDVAIEVMGATPLAISSIGSSQYGANEPPLDWPAMERALVAAGVIHHRSILVGPGGTELATGEQQPDARLRRRLANESGLPVIPVLTLNDEVTFRLDAYTSEAKLRGLTLRTFVNVGGSAADIGPGGAGETLIPPGLSRPRWGAFEASRLGVTGRMAQLGLPIVNLLDVSRLAERYGLPWDPRALPTAGDLPSAPPRPLVVAIGLVGLLAAVVAAHRAGWFRVADWHLPAELTARSRLAPATAMAGATNGRSGRRRGVKARRQIQRSGVGV